MTKKFLHIVIVMFVLLVTLPNVYAADGMFNIGMYTDIYRLSEQADIDLPFLNVFANAATYDKDVTHSGISIGETTIDVNEKLEGMQILFSTDMITIKGEVENSFIYANNVVIEGKLTGDTIIFAPTVQIKETAVVEKDVIIIANNLDIKGTVNGNVIATISEKTTISGVINNDLRMLTQDLVIANETINGDIYIETNADTESLKAKYSNAVIKPLVEEVQETIDWMGIITQGIIIVVVYTLITWLVTKKENNFVQKACEKFKEYTVFGLVMSVVAWMLVLVLPIILIIMAVMGLGIIAWPLLIAYVALLLLVGTTSLLVVGMTIYNTISGRIGKLKIPVIAVIYILLYILTKIPAIATYMNMAMLLIALAVVLVMMLKKLPEQEKTEQDKQ